MTLTFDYDHDLGFQSQASYCHNTHTHTNSGQSVEKIEWKQTHGRTDGRHQLLCLPVEKSKQLEHVQFVSTWSIERYSTINSFDVVADFGNKVECCLDIVAGVDGALRFKTVHLYSAL